MSSTKPTVDDVLKRCTIGGYLANTFAGKALSSVHGTDEWVYATNGHIIVAVPVGAVSENYESIDGYPDPEGVLADVNCKPTKQFSVLDARNAIEDTWKIAPVFRTQDCSACDGHGHTLCPACSQEAECDDCGGSGEIDTDEKISQRVLRNYDDAVLIAGKRFDPTYILRVCELAEALDVESVGVTVLPWGDRINTPLVGMSLSIGHSRCTVMHLYGHYGETTEIKLSDSDE